MISLGCLVSLEGPFGEPIHFLDYGFYEEALCCPGIFLLPDAHFPLMECFKRDIRCVIQTGDTPRRSRLRRHRIIK